MNTYDRHSKICNIPRVTSVFGKEIRGLFEAGPNHIQIGADFASLEARIQGHYVYKYAHGPELAEALVAEKPNDLHCLCDDTQILTKQGWKYFKDISKETKVAQWHKENASITYTYPKEIISKEYNGEMISVEGDRLSILMTPEHRNVVLNSEDIYVDILAKDLKTTDGIIPTHGLLFNNNIYHEHIIEALYEKFVNFKNQNNDIYSEVFRKSSGFVLQSENKAIIEEIQTNLCCYQVQALVHIKSKFDKTIYQTIIPFKNPNLKGSQLRHTTIETVHYTGNVHCVSVDSTYIVCKRNDKIFVTGNSLNAKKLGISRDSAKSFSYACLDKETTQIATQDGWKYFDELHPSDLIKNFDISNDTISYEPILDYVSYVDTLIYNIKLANNTSVTATLDHKWLVSVNGSFEFRETKDLVGCYLIQDVSYDTHTNKFTFIKFKVESITELKKTEVFCITTNSSLFFIKQGDYTGLTGNCMYGAAPEKLSKMLSISLKEAEELYEKYWDAVPALKSLKDKIEEYWVKTGNKEFLLGIDGRKLRSRSKHSLINLLFQSAGAIMCKYSVVYMCQKLEEQNLLGNPFTDSVNDVKVFLMIIYHDEIQLAASPALLKIHKFYGDTSDVVKYNKQLNELKTQLKNPLLDEEELSLVNKEKKSLIHPGEIEAQLFKDKIQSTSDVGHKDDYFYVTENNLVIDAFNFGIKKATDEFDLNVDLGIAWNTGNNWAETH